MRRAPAIRREKMIGVLVSDDEYEQLRQLAFGARKSVGAFVRDLALARLARSRPNTPK